MGDQLLLHRCLGAPVVVPMVVLVYGEGIVGESLRSQRELHVLLSVQ